MSKVAGLMNEAAAAKKAAEDAETERTRARSFDTRAQAPGQTYSHAAAEDEETLGGTKRKRGASRAILG